MRCMVAAEVVVAEEVEEVEEEDVIAERKSVEGTMPPPSPSPMDARSNTTPRIISHQVSID